MITLQLLCCWPILVSAAPYVWTGSQELQLQYVKNMTNLLNSLLYGYDKLIRPSENGEPTIVKIDIEIRSMGPISEMDMAYSMDCYFRQTWADPRLRYNDSSQRVLSLGLAMLDRIWKPDTFFWNGMDSYLHNLTTPNKLVRLYQDGRVLFSSRLTIKAKCPMYLKKYPLDVQRCPLVIGSFAYQEKDVRYRWSKGLNNSVAMAEGVELSQFSLRRTQLFEEILVEKRHGKFSALQLQFLFDRRSGYFLINFYGPCTLIVILSWVALWLNREATGDRITLGVTSILSMTFLGLDSRSDLPRVTYSTALDIYLIICYAFVFGTIIEFAIVHIFTKYGTGDPELKHIETERLERRKSRNSTVDGSTAIIRPNHSVPRSLQSLGDISRYYKSDPNYIRLYRKWVNCYKKPDPFDWSINSVSLIDRLGRIFFPSAFAFVSVIYWNSYLSDE